MNHGLWRAFCALLIAVGAGGTIASFSDFGRFVQREDYAAITMYGLLNIACLGAAGLALAIVLRAADRAEARALGLMLSLGTFSYGWWFGSLRPSDYGVASNVLIPMLKPYIDLFAIACFGFCGAAFTRFTLLYPRPLEREDIMTFSSLPHGSDSLRWINTLEPRLMRFVAPAVHRLRSRQLSDFVSTAGARGLLSVREIALLTRVLRSVGSRRFWLWVSLPLLCALTLSTARVLPGVPPGLLVWTGTRIPFGIVIISAAVLLLLAQFSLFYFLRISYAVAAPEHRRRMMWLVEGFLSVFWVGFILMGADVALSAFGIGIDSIEDMVYPLMALGIVTCLAFSIFGHGALDPALTVRKTAVYGLLGGLMLFVFAGVENFVSNQLADWVGVSQGAGALIAAGTTALLARPLLTQLRTRTDRLLTNILPPTMLAAGPRVPVVVVFADIVGYTRLSAEDESDALTTATVFHRSAHRTANRYRGRVVKTLGDGVLLEFPTADAALAGAHELRSSFAQALDLLSLEDAKLRIGVHNGDAARNVEGDLFGDTINTAARLQTSAQPGEIIASQRTASLVQDKRFAFESVGNLLFKNLPDPIACVRAVQHPAPAGLSEASA